MDDAVASKGEEGELLVMETGVFCGARGKGVVSQRSRRIWSNEGDHSTGIWQDGTIRKNVTRISVMKSGSVEVQIGWLDRCANSPV